MFRVAGFCWMRRSATLERSTQHVKARARGAARTRARARARVGPERHRTQVRGCYAALSQDQFV